MHAGIGYMADEYIENGEWGDFETAYEISVDTFREKIIDGAIWDNTTTCQNEAEKQLKIQLSSFEVEVRPIITPRYCEEPFRCMIGSEIEFTGTTDMYTADGCLDDWKGGSRSRPYQAQLGGYATLGMSNKKFGMPQKCRQWFFPRTSLKKGYPGANKIEYDVKFCIKSAAYTLKQIITDVNKFIETQDCWSFPANPMSQICSDKYCPAWGTTFCKSGRIE